LLERSTHDLARYATASPSLAARRALFAALVSATIAGLLGLMTYALSAGGFGLLDAVVLFCFAVTLPWTVIGFWNAVIGFLIMRFSRDAAEAVTPVAARIRGDEPITASTAILVCIRNEAPARVIRNIEPMIADLVAAGVADRFHVYVLSDTSKQDIAALEETQFGALAERWRGRIPLTYRRREKNTGFKAGNIRDFCERWGEGHDLAVVLDTDSLMPAAAILRLVRIMQAEPRLGILQSLVIGLPSTSAFARLFQFGMRLSMRSYTIGSAWWQGDCGPFWGHNAVIRLAPFIAHCRLPVLSTAGPFGGHVLSHDQIEATLMRRAGYEVRVLAEEDLGWEENPPTLVEFIRRDLRWCQGNMQYWGFLALRGLKPVSRYQLAFAILMFLGSPAWIGLLVFGTLGTALATEPADVVHLSAGLWLLALVYLMWFAPVFATALDVLLRPDERQAFGGAPLFLANVVISTLFNLLLVPIMWFGHTLFLMGLLLGRGIGWIGQVRDDHRVPWTLAAGNFWPHTLLGWAAIIVLAVTHPWAIPVALLVAGGLALSIPLAVLTALPAAGVLFARIGIGRLPEETAPPPMLRALALPAVVAAAPKPRPA
jgi:membrane glycosyltransferase